MKILILSAALVAVSITASAERYSPAETIDKATVRVIDGDTIKVAGEAVRIVGLNAPETHHVCAAELALGLKAKQHAIALVTNAATITLQLQIRAKTGRLVRDKYGRLLGLVAVDRTDWAAHMIAADLAKPWNGRGKRPGWC